MSQIIQPRILKGFRDLLPPAALGKQEMLDSIRKVFTLFGYMPIETPALEYSEILLGKGSEETDKQLFRFSDQGGRDVAMRFDLTVPLARFAAMHLNTLGVPFRRYHIAPVWRAEKPQRGRFREFTQCDFDILGSTSASSDAEIVQLIHSIFSELQIPVRIRINHRGLLGGILAVCGAQGREVAALRAIDKLEKLGKDVVSQELQQEAKLDASQIDSLFEMLEASTKNSSALETLAFFESRLADCESGLAGATRLNEIFTSMQEAGIDQQLALDTSIARGLDYYTGVVFETQSVDLPDIGSICSGGRYDNLTGVYSKKSHPGVGASVGLDRTLAALEELGVLSTRSSCALALLTRLDDNLDGARMKLASELRDAGISIEVYPEKSKLGAQLKYADRREIKLAIIAGDSEFKTQTFGVKHLDTGQQIECSRSELVQTLKNLAKE